MFILTFPNETIQKFLANKINARKLSNAITQIKEPFKKYPEADFYVYSVFNNNKEQAFRSLEWLRNFKDSLVVADFTTDAGCLCDGPYREFMAKKINRGVICLLIDNKAKLYSPNFSPCYKLIDGTWEEVILGYQKLLREKMNI